MYLLVRTSLSELSDYPLTHTKFIDIELYDTNEWYCKLHTLQDAVREFKNT